MKQLPEKIALEKAVHGQRLYQGNVAIQQMSRLIDMLADPVGMVEFSIQFAKMPRLLGKAQIQISATLPLTCSISQKQFMLPVKINSRIAFIDDLLHEDLLDINMDASWVENGMVKPLEILEDELILVVPDVPFDENYNDNSVTENIADVSSQKHNPFAVLKNLKALKD